MKIFYFVFILIFTLLSSNSSATKDTVAVLVDSLVYSKIQNEVTDYITSVEAEFPVEIMVFHDHDWKNKTFMETREFIQDKWKKHNIKGVVLVGYFPLMLYQVKGQGTFPMVQALGYEDIDGEFTNDGTFDGSNFITGKADPTSLKDAHGKNRQFSDVIYDHHKWADNINYSNSQEVEEKVKLELWCAVIRPYQDYYNIESYSSRVVAQLKEYLTRCARYSRKELPYNRRGFVMSSKDWTSSVSSLSKKMNPIYGEENVAKYPSSSSGYSYMLERGIGLELASYYAHSASWFHQNERSPYQTIRTSDLVNANGPGAIVTLGFNCHGADYFESPTGCLGQHYMFEGNGLTFVGNTISTGNNQSSIINKLAEGKYLGNAFLETLNADYQGSASRGGSVRTQQMWGNIILGNPFIWVNKDKDMSNRGAQVSGVVTNGEDVILTFKKEAGIYTVNKTQNGQIEVAKLDTGKYEVKIETIDGAVISSKELEITASNQTIIDWNIEIPLTGSKNADCYYLKSSSTSDLPSDFANDGANLELWNKTTADVIGQHVQDFRFYEGKEISTDIKTEKCYLRKHFSIYNRKPGTRVYIYSACAASDIYLFVNGKAVQKSSDSSPRSFFSVVKTRFDITDRLVEGNNYLNAIAPGYIHISDPVYEMETEPVAAIPQEPTAFKAQLTDNGGLIFSWIDNAENEDGFILERQMMNGEFEIVSYIGKDKTELNYPQMEDNKGLSYRICSYNYAGKSAFSTAVKTEIRTDIYLSEISVFPNPFNDNIVIQNVEPNSKIIVKTMAGQSVYNVLSKGGNQNINLGMLPQGMYLISVITPHNRITTEKVVKN